MSCLRAWNPRLLGLAVESESLVLPVLVQSGLEVAATFVAREAESLGLLGLVDCEKDKLSVRSHERLATPNVQGEAPALAGCLHRLVWAYLFL